MSNRLTLGKKQDRKWLGVCSGLAEHLGMDVTVVRMVTVVVAIAGGIIGGVFLYLVASVVMPAPEA